MKKLLLSSLFVLFGIIAYSSDACAQNYIVINNTTIDYRVGYGCNASGTVGAGNMISIPYCGTTFPCSIAFSFPGSCSTTKVEPIPCSGSFFTTWGVPNSTGTMFVNTGCPADPQVAVDIVYDGTDLLLH